MDQSLVNFHAIIASLVFSAIGLVVLGISFFLFDKITPGELWKEIVEKKNTALAITVGAVILAIAHIIAAAISG